MKFFSVISQDRPPLVSSVMYSKVELILEQALTRKFTEFLKLKKIVGISSDSWSLNKPCSPVTN